MTPAWPQTPRCTVAVAFLPHYLAGGWNCDARPDQVDPHSTPYSPSTSTVYVVSSPTSLSATTARPTQIPLTPSAHMPPASSSALQAASLHQPDQKPWPHQQRTPGCRTPTHSQPLSATSVTNSDHITPGPSQPDLATQSIHNHFTLFWTSPTPHQHYEPAGRPAPITKDEITHAIRALKPHKCAGLTDIANESRAVRPSYFLSSTSSASNEKLRLFLRILMTRCEPHFPPLHSQRRGVCGTQPLEPLYALQQCIKTY